MLEYQAMLICIDIILPARKCVKLMICCLNCEAVVKFLWYWAIQSALELEVEVGDIDTSDDASSVTVGLSDIDGDTLG